METLDQNPEISYVADFIKEGGVFKTIWGQVKGEFFQTAMQVGSYYVDVSNDTVTITKPKVEIKRLSVSGFKNIDSIREYCEIKKKYHKVEIFRNADYPSLAPFFPFFVVKDGQISLSYDEMVHKLIILRSGYKELELFVEKESHELPVLSKRYQKELRNFFKIFGRNQLAKELVKMSPWKAGNPFWKYTAEPPAKQIAGEHLRLAKKIAKLFNERYNLKKSLGTKYKGKTH